MSTLCTVHMRRLQEAPAAWHEHPPTCCMHERVCAHFLPAGSKKPQDDLKGVADKICTTFADLKVSEEGRGHYMIEQGGNICKGVLRC